MNDPTLIRQTADPASKAPSGASLVLIYGGELGLCHPLVEACLIGRSEDCGIHLEDSEASRNHARVFPWEDGWSIEDLGSTNGTQVNGVDARGPRRLSNGDLIKVGGVVLKFLEGGNQEALYFEEIHRLTILDGLTGIPNKRSLLESLARDVSRAQRYGRPLSAVMLDVDHFKRVNDTYGHLAGDLTLQHLARTVLGTIRQEDSLARFGGEEFAILMPETDLAEAGITCERIRRAVEDMVIPLASGPLRITVSLGLAELEAGMTPPDLLAAADAQLYRAKGAGRNRTMSVLL